MNVSLTVFCKEHKLAKTTVYRDCQRLQIDTSNGLDSQAVDKLLAEYGIEKAFQPEKVTVETGNHRKEVNLTVGSKTTNLETFRTNRERSTLANRKEFVLSLVDYLDQIEDGMERAEQEQEQELQEIRLIKRQGVKRIEQFRRRADEYRIKSDILASIQNAELDELEDITDEVNSLGKPLDSSRPPS